MKFVKREPFKYNETIRTRYYGIDLIPALKILWKVDKAEDELNAINSLKRTLKSIAILHGILFIGLLASMMFIVTRENPNPLFIMLAMLIGFFTGFVIFILCVKIHCEDYMKWVGKLQDMK